MVLPLCPIARLHLEMFRRKILNNPTRGSGTHWTPAGKSGSFNTPHLFLELKTPTENKFRLSITTHDTLANYINKTRRTTATAS
jgi:hypothetical protein